MHTKSLRGVEIKDADKGQVTAVFSRFNVIDHDGDVTLPGAFDDNTPVRISAYGHASWGSALPVGKGVVRSTGSEAILDGEFFLNTTHGRDTFEVVKEMGELQEWSYSVEPTKHSFGEFEGQRVQFLEKLKGPQEISPVLAGAGIGTRTLTVKSQTDMVQRLIAAGLDPEKVKAAMADAPVGFKRTIGPHETATVSRAWDTPRVLEGLKSCSPADLRSVFAWVDPGADPEAPGSYKLAHHHGVGGPANVRACVAGIASLNGAGVGVPDGDRKAAYDHLAAHLRDADREPPALLDGQGGALKFADEGAAVMAAVSSYIDRAAQVMAMRAAKGKGLSPASVDLLAWLEDDLGRLKSVLANPHIAADEPLADDELSVLLAAVARANDL
jgi:hypothetical protein